VVSLEWILLGLRILATVILYTFLGVAFYIIWRELKQLESQAMSQSRASYQLRVIAAAEDQPLAVGETLPLQPITILGRAAENTIVVKDDSVSAAHARLHRENGVWWLEDLDSHTGTTLNDSLLSKPTPLAEGDIIGIGDLRFKLESSGQQGSKVAG
jgi:pSer/pThr/pTyr-binding forkhead associated (FHA) protein